MSKISFSRLIRIVTGDPTDGADEPLLEAGVSKLEKFAHFWALVGRSFVRNRCPVRASALSYSTLLAMIPLLAVAVSVTSSLLKSEGQQRIEQFIQQFVDSVIPPAPLDAIAPPAPGHPNPPAFSVSTPTNSIPSETNDNLTEATTNSATGSVRQLGTMVGVGATNAPAPVTEVRVVAAQREAAKYIFDFVQNTRSGTLGVTGMILLIFVAITMLSRVEETFNDIWGVTRGRNWFVRIIQYWAVISLGPLLLACALGLASGPYLQNTKSTIGEMPFIGSLFFKLLPLVMLWLTFALLYQLVPNTKVRFSAALFGGMVAGSLWHLNNVFGFLYVSRVVTNSKMYGSLGLVPVFMAGIYLSWLILLFGAQMAYAFQNREAYLQDKLAENVNQRGREFVALRLMTCIGQRFQHGLPPATIQVISRELGVPSRLAQQVLHTLLAARLVVEIAGLEPAYAPARPLETINCHHILLAMRATHGQELITRDEPMRAEVLGEFARIQAAEKAAAASVTMLALVSRPPARLENTPGIGLPDSLKASPSTVIELSSPSPSGETSPPALGGTPVASPRQAATAATPTVDPEAKPISMADIASATPTAESSTDDNQSFPL
jgi:membrane protein